MKEHPIALQATHLYKSFKDFSLNDVSIDLYSGEVHVIVGENGSGKSTLMKLLCGWYPVDNGSIMLEGNNEVCFHSVTQGLEQGIIYINQDVEFFDNLSVAENIYLGVFNSYKKANEFFNPYKFYKMSKLLLDTFNIKISPYKKGKELGFAEKQLISALRGYVSGAKIIIFDEPSSAMNDIERSTLFTIIKSLKLKEKAIFYISHRMDEIKELGDRISVMQKGVITHTRSCEDFDIEVLVKIMSDEIHLEKYPKIETHLGPYVLEVNHLKKDPVLKDISFSLRKGEIIGITGLMGSGRTLLASCLFGQVEPEKGEIKVFGKPTHFKSPNDAMNSGISLIPENRMINGLFYNQDLVGNMTNASLKRFVHARVLNDYMMQDLTQEYVKEFSIGPGRNSDDITTYSGGNMQKVLISRWLMNRSIIYIMDEPTRSIDAASKVDIYNAMSDLVSKGCSIILISSEIEEIIGMSDRILVLSQGKIIKEIPQNEATKDMIIEYSTIGL